jgi:D-glycero-alpha-D-manno-heptose-7-phosphate kinase
MIIETTAPTRVDLAGGTVDIWPLYLFHEHAVTVNFAVDLIARCRLATRNDRKILLRSVDTGESAQFDNIEPLQSTSSLKMLSKLIHFFSPQTGLEMTTECQAPAGSGLAGSSALNIAICGALNALTGSRFDADTLIQIAKNVEAQVIDVPTGDQDFYPAMHGGLAIIHLTPRGVLREEIPIDLDSLSRRLILVFSGQQRNSGINNWDVMKRHIDGDRKIYQAFEGIVKAANTLASALREGNFDAIDGALNQEWQERRMLSDGISTPEIEDIMDKAKALGGGSAKICGAGGGGCLVLTVPDGQREEIQKKLQASGVRVIDYKIARRGLDLKFVEK